MRRPAIPLLVALLLALPAGTAAAQVRGVEVRVPRAFGYFLGDLVEAQADIAVDPGFTLQRASLPQPGPVTYWLDLRGVAVEAAPGRVRLRLTYQTFYAALDARQLTVPGFSVTLASETPGGITSAKAEIPGWSLGVSPLREVQPPARDDPTEYLRPDGRGGRLDPVPWLRAALACLALAALALAGLAYDRAWFGRSRRRPFARAARALRRLGRAGASGGEGGYREALRLVHRGLDETDGRRVLADDLPAFLDRHPAFRGEGAALARFFAASRRAFFGRDAAGASAAWPRPEVEASLRRLAAAERAA
ncbi:nonribosomal peptide synthetase MxaA [Methylobacterium sp. NEAU 140]|uniref:nonribosomal peptide synthetase MxaA n=1 Tax=Methylobacterium sp. NEAU 140 TaxID=3064945 RepID=UPI002735BCC7|nr:nonribosomal peptide synthetase MxaA [Methylobacterium sp. NEAU 140]MDP4021374.1 nonribosomal peptide synthetase MxaA [Methylobacterium sp. NEAU 140]